MTTISASTSQSSFLSLKEIKSYTTDLAKAAHNFDGNRVVQKGQELQKIGRNMFRLSLTDYFKCEDPFPIALELVDVLCDEKLQKWQGPRYEISKAARIFMEFSFLKSHLDGSGRIFCSTHYTRAQRLKEVMQALPEHQVEAYLDLKCLYALFNQSGGNGVYHKYLTQAAMTSLTVSPADFVKLLAQAWSDGGKGDDWFKTTSYWRWAVTQVNTEKDFQNVNAKLKVAYEIGGMVSLSAAEILITTVKHAENPKVKKLAFKSLIPLSEVKKQDQLTKKTRFWMTRLFVVRFLSTLSNHDNHPYKEESASQLIDRLIYETNLMVFSELFSTFINNKDEWGKIIQEKYPKDSFPKRLQHVISKSNQIQAKLSNCKTISFKNQQKLDEISKEILSKKTQLLKVRDEDTSGAEQVENLAASLEKKLEVLEKEESKLLAEEKSGLTTIMELEFQKTELEVLQNEILETIQNLMPLPKKKSK